ncbi:MAG TPA: hypothetical protein VGJ46_02770 [Candidatus Limnocylindrales bacterium]
MTESEALDETTALLERTPRVVRALLADLPEGWVGGRTWRAGGRLATSSAT